MKAANLNTPRISMKLLAVAVLTVPLPAACSGEVDGDASEAHGSSEAKQSMPLGRIQEARFGETGSHSRLAARAPLSQHLSAASAASGAVAGQERPENITPEPNHKMEPPTLGDDPPVQPRSDPNDWTYDGNSPPSVKRLGTNNNVAFEIEVNNQRVMRYEPGLSSLSPNLIGGHPANGVAAPGQIGVTIAGGGAPDGSNLCYSSLCTISGGAFNTGVGEASTVLGGEDNYAGAFATAGGHRSFALGSYSFAVGESVVARAFNSTAFGQFNVGNGTSEFWVSTDPLFEVGNGQDSQNLSNAFTILKNGNAGFGFTQPNHKVMIGHDSTTSNTHVLLHEFANDFARLSFGNNASQNVWHVGALPQAITANALFTIWYQPTGSVIELYGDGRMWLRTLPAHSSANTLCASTSSGSAFIGRCSSSQRYKKDIRAFEPGLEIVERLRSVSFTSVSSGERDLGFIAEEVAKVHPLLATYDEKGRPESVRYMELTAVLSNAIRQQQETIRGQEGKLAELERVVAKQQQLLEENSRTMRSLIDAVKAGATSRLDIKR